MNKTINNKESKELINKNKQDNKEINKEIKLDNQVINSKEISIDNKIKEETKMKSNERRTR